MRIEAVILFAVIIFSFVISLGNIAQILINGEISRSALLLLLASLTLILFLVILIVSLVYGKDSVNMYKYYVSKI